MSSEWMEGMCNETTGFLFRHQCTQYPEGELRSVRQADLRRTQTPTRRKNTVRDL